MLTVTPIEAFSDNYIWCVQGETGKQVFVVDPGDDTAVPDALAANTRVYCAQEYTLANPRLPGIWKNGMRSTPQIL